MKWKLIIKEKQKVCKLTGVGSGNQNISIINLGQGKVAIDALRTTK
ncbi:MAG: hypothetical protein JXA77_08300 [Bacteroidales bacterium]|nr:hypothetical protein [Bacteroidales bacterium]MBN2820931.1 hypothetical protein [Bacteroidales bacterium]